MKFFSLVLLLNLLSQSILAAEPPLYPYPAPKEITLEDIIPAAMDNLSQPGYVPGLKAGEKVLIVSDRSVDPLTKEAFYVAAWRLGASQVDTVVLQGRLDVKDPADIIYKFLRRTGGRSGYGMRRVLTTVLSHWLTSIR